MFRCFYRRFDSIQENNYLHLHVNVVVFRSSFFLTVCDRTFSDRFGDLEYGIKLS